MVLLRQLVPLTRAPPKVNTIHGKSQGELQRLVNKYPYMVDTNKKARSGNDRACRVIKLT